MTFLLLAACIENELGGDTPEKPFDDTTPGDTAAPDTDTDTTVDTGDTDGGTVTDDTGAPVDTATDTDTPVDTGEPPDTEPPGPLEVLGECASTWTGWADTAATEPELNVVGMYESALGRPGQAFVTVTRTTDMVLALTSYEAVEWQVDLAPGTNVGTVLVSYYEPGSTVTFTSATTAPVNDVGWSGACAYEIPDRDLSSGCETPELETTLEGYTGLAMSSFQGCYVGGEFTVE